MNEQNLMRALTDIDEDLILDADRPRQRTSIYRRLMPLAAACLGVVMLGGLYLLWGGDKTQKNGAAESTAMENEPAFAYYSSETLDAERNGQRDQALETFGGSGTESAVTEELAQIPADFAVVIRWERQGVTLEYDSATQTVSMDGAVLEAIAFDGSMKAVCWNVASMPEPFTGFAAAQPLDRESEGAVSFTWTADGETYQRWLDADDYDKLPVNRQLYNELMETLEDSLIWGVLETVLPKE